MGIFPFRSEIGIRMTDTPAKSVPIIDAPHAPFVYYEGAAALGFSVGVVNITLAANRTWIGEDGAVNEQVVTAYLRGSIPAALSLRAAIDAALLLAQAPAEQNAESSEAKN